ncbi:MAG: ATP-binding cassette domain-containing protein [Sphingomonadales bacterium]
MSIEVKNLYKYYGEQAAVRDVSFSVKKGEIVAFLGPNGAGKSTTMKIMTGFMPASEGEVEICGIKVDIDKLETRRLIGYLPENNPLYTDMYVREYLEFVGRIYKIKNFVCRKGVCAHTHKLTITRFSWPTHTQACPHTPLCIIKKRGKHRQVWGAKNITHTQSMHAVHV